MRVIDLIPTLMVLFYASMLMTMLLDVHFTTLPASKKLLIAGGVPLVMAVNAFLALRLDMSVYGKLYPLLGQLPIFLIFLIVGHRKFVKTFFTLLTVMFLSYPYRLCTSAVRSISMDSVLLTILSVMCACTLIGFCVYRFMKPNFNYAIEYFSNRDILWFCAIPVFYNIAIYYIGRYTVEKDMLPVFHLLFLIALVAYFLLINIFRTTREKQQLENEKNMLQMQMENARLHLSELKSTQEQSIIYRHDMRHHLSLINGFVSEGDMSKIKNYLISAEADIDAVTPTHYCENETVNLILSSFDKRSKKERVILCADVQLPENLSVSDTELCALFSNALENAISAASQVENEKLRKVSVRAMINGDKLLLSTENAYVGKIEMAGELPVSKNKDPGHGFGIKSMVAIMERHHGLYSFVAEDGIFEMHLMLPLTVENQ